MKSITQKTKKINLSDSETEQSTYPSQIIEAG